MNILVLGASGGCGRWVCRLAVERGYRVTAAVRPSSRFEAASPSVRVERGEVLDQAFVSRLLEQSSGDGSAAVISCLGLRRRNPLNPWSPVISPPDLTTRVAELLAERMPRQGVLRLVAISAAGVGDSLARTHPLIRWMIARSNLGVSYRDLESMERALIESELDWMAVRPTTLTPGKPTGRATVVNGYGLFDRVPRADVAAWMLDQLELPHWSARTPLIALRRGARGG